MKVKLVKIKEVVYITRCQWVAGQDADGKDIIPFGLLWERKRHAEAVNIAVVHGAETYVLAGETRRYHTWVEKVTRYRDGSEESVTVQEYNRPTRPEAPQSGYTSCACRDCMDVTASSDTSKPELCEECTEAGCEAYRPGDTEYEALPAHMRECQRDDAYGEPTACDDDCAAPCCEGAHLLAELGDAHDFGPEQESELR